MPSLVAVGYSDQLTPPDQARKIHAGITGAEFHIFKDCGHLPALENPAETTDLLRAFLTR